MLKISRSPTGTDRLNSHFLRPFSYSLQRCLWWRPVKLGVSPCRSRLLTGPHHYHPGIVQQAQGRSAETAVSPHHNNQYNLRSHAPTCAGRMTSPTVKELPALTAPIHFCRIVPELGERLRPVAESLSHYRPVFIFIVSSRLVSSQLRSFA
jgi:hypothetical protein